MENKSNWQVTRFHAVTPMFGDVARKESAQVLALAGAPSELISKLCHHVDEETTIGGFSPIKFIGRSDGFALIAYGSGIGIVNEVAGLLAMAWAIRLGRPVTQSISSGSCSAGWIPYKRRYCIPKLVITKKTRHKAQLERDPAKHVSELILRGLRTQAEFCGVSLGKQIDIDLIGMKPRKPASLGHGGAFLETVKDAVFDVNLMLSGWWSVGYITSKGYGSFNSDFITELTCGPEEGVVNVVQ